MKKRLLSALLCACMLFSLLPGSALSSEPEGRTGLGMESGEEAGPGQETPGSPALSARIAALPALDEALAGVAEDEGEDALAQWAAANAGLLDEVRSVLAAWDALDETARAAAAGGETLEDWRGLLSLLDGEAEAGEADGIPDGLALPTPPDAEYDRFRAVGEPEISLFSLAGSADDPGFVIPINPERKGYNFAHGTGWALINLVTRKRTFDFELTQEQYDAAFRDNLPCLSYVLKADETWVNLYGAQATLKINGTDVLTVPDIATAAGGKLYTSTFSPDCLRVGTNQLTLYCDGGFLTCWQGSIALGGGTAAGNTVAFQLEDFQKATAAAEGSLTLSTLMRNRPERYKYDFYYNVYQDGDNVWSTNITEQRPQSSGDKTVSHRVTVPKTAGESDIVCWLLTYDELGNVAGSDRIIYTMSADGMTMVSASHSVSPQQPGQRQRTVRLHLTKLFPNVALTGCTITRVGNNGNYGQTLEISNDGWVEFPVTEEMYRDISSSVYGFLGLEITCVYAGQKQTLKYSIDEPDFRMDLEPPELTVNPEAFTFTYYTSQTVQNKTKEQMEAEILAQAEYRDDHPSDSAPVTIASTINADKPGSYKATLTAVDLFGSTTVKEVTVRLAYATPEITAPTVEPGTEDNPKCGFSATVIEFGETVVFSGLSGFVVGYSPAVTYEACAYRLYGGATLQDPSCKVSWRVQPNVQYYVRSFLHDGSLFYYSDPVAFSCGEPKNFGALTAQDQTVCYYHTEASHEYIIPVTRTGGSEGRVTLKCTLDGADGRHVQLNTSQLVFEDGETKKNISYTLTDGEAFNGSRSFVIQLTEPTPTTINGGDAAALTVTYSTTNKEVQPSGITLSDGPVSGTPSQQANPGNPTAVVLFTKEVDVSSVASASYEIPAELNFGFSCSPDDAVFANAMMNGSPYSLYQNVVSISAAYEVKATASGAQLASSPDPSPKMPLPWFEFTMPFTVGPVQPVNYSGHLPSFNIPKGCKSVTLELKLTIQLKPSVSAGMKAGNLSKAAGSYLANSKFTSVTVTAKPSLQLEGFTFDSERDYYPGDQLAIYPVLNYASKTLPSSPVVQFAGGNAKANAQYDENLGAYLCTIPQEASTSMVSIYTTQDVRFESTNQSAPNNFVVWKANIPQNIAVIQIPGQPSIQIDSDKKDLTLPKHTVKISLSDGTPVSDVYYVWSASEEAPGSGWSPMGNQRTSVTGAGYTGTMYIHLRYTHAGRTVTARQAFSFQQPVFAVEGGGGLWQNAPVTLALTRTCSQDAPLTVTVSQDGGEAATMAGDSYIVETSGSYLFTATDDYGFRQTVEKTLYIDRTPPVITADSGAYLPGLVYPSVSIPVTFSDAGGAGLDFQGYAFSESASALSGVGGYTPYISGLVTCAAESGTTVTKYLHLYASDKAGNTRTEVYGPFQLRQEPENIVLPAVSAWLVEEGGVTKIEYRAVPGTYELLMVNDRPCESDADLGGSITVTECGYYTVSVLDSAGNEAEAGVAVNSAALEKDPPSVDLSVKNRGEDLAYGQYAPTAQLTIRADDAVSPFYRENGLPDPKQSYGSGIQSVEVWDGKQWMPLEPGEDGAYRYDLPGNGSYPVRVTDRNGNVTKKSCEVKNVDGQAPTVQISGISPDWEDGAQKITVTYSDGVSGIDRARYAIVQSSAEPYPTTGLLDLPASGKTVSVSENGERFLYYEITDRAGNAARGCSGPIRIDSAAPTLKISGGDTGAASLTWTVSSTFGPSGGTLAVSKDGGPSQDITGRTSYSVTGAGVYVFTAKSGAGRTASVTKTVYAVAFDAAGGSPVETQLVTGGGKASLPTPPERTGYTFSKWQKNGADYSFDEAVTQAAGLTAVWTLDAPTAAVKADTASAVYTGEVAVTLTAQPGHALAEGLDYTYQWYKNGGALAGATASALSLTDVADSGTYKVRVTVRDGGGLTAWAYSGETAVTIQRALPVVGTPPTASGITYGDTLAKSTLSGGGAGVPGVFSWKDSTLMPTAADSGTTPYAVVFTPEDADNYSAAETAVKLKVDRKNLAIAGAEAEGRDYSPGNTAVSVSGGALVGVVTRNGAPDRVALDGSAAAGSVESDAAGRGKAVTVTGYALTGEDSGNYTLTQPEGLTVDVSPAAGTASVEIAGWVYGQAAQPPAPASATNGTAAVTYRYTGTLADGTQTPYDSADPPSQAGSYTVAATFAATDNYRQVTAEQDFAITPRMVTVLWKDTVFEYDGTARTPGFGLVGLTEADERAVSAVLSGGGQAEAGFHSVAAALEGPRAFNYALTNPGGTLTIQRAPVVFTVADNQHRADGGAHTATVTAAATGAPFAGFTVAYRQGDAEVDAPTRPGVYDVYAAITDGNYRHAGSADGAARKIGVLTLYRQTAPAAYTVSFLPGEGEDVSGSTAPLEAALADTVRVLPGCGFTRTGWVFAGWTLDGRLYRAGETLVQPAQNVALTARWEQAVYRIGGVVRQDGSTVEHAVVTLMRGAAMIAETVAGDGGRYQFDGVPPGLYNLVASWDGVTMTVKAEISAADVEDAEILLPEGKTNSVVEVLAGTPGIVVGNLEQTFGEGDAENEAVFTPEDREVVENGGEVEIKFTARMLPADETDAAWTVIGKQAGGSVDLYLDLSLQKTVTDQTGAQISPLSSSGSVLLETVVPLPAALQGKYQYTVYRVHQEPGGDAEADALTGQPNEAGEYIEVSEDKTCLTIFARKFSTYAIAWTAAPSGGRVSKVTVTPPEHGSVSVSPTSPAAGQTVVITVKPEEGWAVERVAVTDAAGNPLDVTDNGDGTYRYVQPGGRVTVTAIFRRAETRPPWNPFADVAEGDWFYDSVRYVYESGLMSGTAETRFSPGGETSRAMIATVIWRMAGEPEAEAAAPFGDVEADTWYTAAVAWAAEAGVVEGYSDGLFHPDDPITREQLAAMLWRYDSRSGGVPAPEGGGTLAAYRDAAQVSGYALPAVRWACGGGLLNGKGGGMLDPGGSATRAEIAAVVARYEGRKRPQ